MYGKIDIRGDHHLGNETLSGKSLAKVNLFHRLLEQISDSVQLRLRVVPHNKRQPRNASEIDFNYFPEDLEDNSDRRRRRWQRA